MLARVPWTPKVSKARPRPRELNRNKRRHLVDTVAGLMKAAKEAGATATLLNFEAPCRHGIRCRLTLQGWRWQDADTAAADVVSAALRQIGAKRPTWAEGQPEWSQNGAGAMIERTRCIRCHGRLPEMHRKFCGELCASSHQMALGRIRDADERKAYDLAAGR